MEHPNPWRENTTRATRNEKDAHQASSETQTERSPAGWGYFLSAMAGLATLILLFRPWLSSWGPTGEASADAFGRISGFTDDPQGWTPEAARRTDVTGFWAILAAAAIVITVFAVLAYLHTRNEAVAHLATAASIAVAVCVLATVVYLNTKAPELRFATQSSDGLKNLMDNLGGNTEAGKHPVGSAGLEPSALIASTLALGGAVSAVTQWLCTPTISTALERENVAAETVPAQHMTRALEHTGIPAHVEPATPPASRTVAPEDSASMWHDLMFNDLIANASWMHTAAEAEDTEERKPALSN